MTAITARLIVSTIHGRSRSGTGEMPQQVCACVVHQVGVVEDEQR